MYSVVFLCVMKLLIVFCTWGFDFGYIKPFLYSASHFALKLTVFIKTSNKQFNTWMTAQFINLLPSMANNYWL